MWRINDPTMAGVPFLVFLNKTDKANRMEQEFVIKQLDIEGLTQMRPARVQECSALDGSGIIAGVNQMIAMIESNGVQVIAGSTTATGTTNPIQNTPSEPALKN